MSDFDDMGLGGMFDFDGDGKTSFFEYSIADNMFQETRKDKEPGTYSGGRSRSPSPAPAKIVIPEAVDKKQYNALSDYFDKVDKGTSKFAMFLTAFFAFIPLLILSMDLYFRSCDLIQFLFALGGTILSYRCFLSFYREYSRYIRNMNALEKAYAKGNPEHSPMERRIMSRSKAKIVFWLVFTAIAAIITVIIVIYNINEDKELYEQLGFKRNGSWY